MKQRLLQFALLLAAAILLAPFFTDFVREVVVIPLLYLLWLVRFLLAAVPQASLWACLVGLVGLVLALSLVERRRASLVPTPPPPPEPGRVEQWEGLLRRSQQDNYFKWRLAQQLQRLALATIAHQQEQSFQETRQQLRQGRLEMPPQILAYFQASLQPLGYLPKRRSLFAQKQPSPSPLDLDPALIIQYLETLHPDSPASEEPS